MFLLSLGENVPKGESLYDYINIWMEYVKEAISIRIFSVVIHWRKRLPETGSENEIRLNRYVCKQVEVCLRMDIVA